MKALEIEVISGSHLDDSGDWTNIAELAGKGLNVLSGYLTTEKVRHFCCDHPYGKVPQRE